MLKTGLIVAFALASTLPAIAQSDGRLSNAPRKTLEKPLSRAPNPCAAFGPGFVKVEGSDTCVRLGGSISVGTGGGSGLRSGPR
jgi:hypothetical protein